MLLITQAGPKARTVQWSRAFGTPWHLYGGIYSHSLRHARARTANQDIGDALGRYDCTQWAVRCNIINGYLFFASGVSYQAFDRTHWRFFVKSKTESCTFWYFWVLHQRRNWMYMCWCVEIVSYLVSRFLSDNMTPKYNTWLMRLYLWLIYNTERWVDCGINSKTLATTVLSY